MTYDQNEQLHREFVELSDSAEPGRGIDISQAVRDGRSQLRRRRFAAYGTVVAVMVAIAVLSYWKSTVLG